MSSMPDYKAQALASMRQVPKLHGSQTQEPYIESIYLNSNSVLASFDELKWVKNAGGKSNTVAKLWGYLQAQGFAVGNLMHR